MVLQIEAVFLNVWEHYSEWGIIWKDRGENPASELKDTVSKRHMCENIYKLGPEEGPQRAKPYSISWRH